MASSGWYYRVMGVELGPIDFAELQAMASSGDLGPDSYVRPDGGEWSTADKVPGLFEISRTPAPEFDLDEITLESPAAFTAPRRRRTPPEVPANKYPALLRLISACRILAVVLGVVGFAGAAFGIIQSDALVFCVATMIGAMAGILMIGSEFVGVFLDVEKNTRSTASGVRELIDGMADDK